MAIIELSMDGRPVVSVGDEKPSDITIGLIKSPHSDQISLQVFLVRKGEREPKILALQPPRRHQSLRLRCLKSGSCVQPGAEWLLDEDQNQSDPLEPYKLANRGNRGFSCKISMPGEGELEFVASENQTIQLVFDYRFFSARPNLQIGRFNGDCPSGDDHWYERVIPFGKTVTVNII